MFQLTLPPKTLFGNKAIRHVGALARELGSRPLLVTGRTALRAGGRLDEILRQLGDAGCHTVLFDQVEHDPSIDTVERGIDAARRDSCDSVLAVGGGSALDAGKLIAGLTNQPFSVMDFFDGIRDIERPALPFLAAPTTAGTGSECTKVAVLTDPARGIKKGLRHEWMMPRIALVDPEQTLSAPPDVTAQSGMDALTQAVECYVGRGANPVTDALAERAISLLAGNIEKAVHEGNRIEHREGVALGSFIGGMAFGNAGLGAVHGLAHPVGILHGIPHGLVCAVLLPILCEFNLPVRREKFAVVARLIGVKNADDVPAALTRLNAAIGIPPTFREFGLSEESLPRILQDCRSGSMANNPREASDDDLARIVRCVL